MPAVTNAGEPCAGDSHAWFDGWVLETELLGSKASSAGQRPPCQRSTLQCLMTDLGSEEWLHRGAEWPAKGRAELENRIDIDV